jgi:hypothetical protein
VISFAHIAGMPVEETLASLGPALLIGSGLAWAKLRAQISGTKRTRSSGVRSSSAPTRRTTNRR